MGENGWTPNTDTLPYRGTSAGGGYSTAGDLLRFANAVQAHRLLDPQHTAMLTTGSVDSPIGRYAFGFDEQNINGTHCYGHGGGAEGMSGQLKICPDAHYTIVVLSNFDPPSADRVADFIANRLPKP
jgi:CubicO group peptidase (beta-lactamase class C family)